MICESFTQQGSMHKENGLPNQDAAAAKVCRDGGFAVLCDGVSLKTDLSFSNSEMAARICLRSAVSYLEKALDEKEKMDSDKIVQILQETFQFANSVLKDTLAQANIPLFDCQTTMIVMIYVRGRLYGGIAGDGGIVFVTKNHRMSIMMTHLKTSPSVYPISDEDQWRFFTAGDSADPIVAALGATDGIFDTLVGVQDGAVYANFEAIDHFLSISSVRKAHRQFWLKKSVEAIPGYDDKSVAILIDTKRMKKTIC